MHLLVMQGKPWKVSLFVHRSSQPVDYTAQNIIEITIDDRFGRIRRSPSIPM
ncbi:MAG: hypothetical protein JNM76_14250 [Betaproteobacteria bacterium]|nr:hypothetical protein [Betaproteobacteria bacterium]